MSDKRGSVTVDLARLSRAKTQSHSFLLAVKDPSPELVITPLLLFDHSNSSHSLNCEHAPIASKFAPSMETQTLSNLFKALRLNRA